MEKIKSDGWSTSYYELPEGVNTIEELADYRDMNCAIKSIFVECYMMNGGDNLIPSWAREIQDLIEHRNMNFAVGNIFKACYRLGLKEGNSASYDLNKIHFFAEREKNRRKRINI